MLTSSRTICLLVAQEAGVAVSIVPQPLAWRAAEQIAGFGLGRQGDDVPSFAAALHFGDDAARHKTMALRLLASPPRPAFA